MPSSSINAEQSGSLEAKDEIMGALLNYTRGIDRLDGDLVAAAFHPGATCHDYGSNQALSIEDFVPAVIPKLRDGYSATQHRISNVAIQVDGDTALSEAYVLAFHIQETDDKPRLHTFNGRYVDNFEKRDGQWKIAKRTLRVDWSKVETIDASMNGAYVPSARDKTDPIYQ